ncbi:hypothetical protein [Streptomyces bambusae]|uniref:Uncharacterized protein n=1 Tax=Streptomyces bambusae TaxID=1550616 RepID=A0ABS6Z4Q4_9ACTN|nr:hypothetical protein [Streptomyces bambusae]MBW5482702.1 hypothetical protein [Streptomyces bambusae]
MSAPTYTRSVAGSAAGADARLPWWALALPVLGFGLLLLLLAGSGQGHPAPAEASAIGQVTGQILRFLG